MKILPTKLLLLFCLLTASGFASADDRNGDRYNDRNRRDGRWDNGRDDDRDRRYGNDDRNRRDDDDRNRGYR